MRERHEKETHVPGRGGPIPFRVCATSAGRTTIDRLRRIWAPNVGGWNARHEDAKFIQLSQEVTRVGYLPSPTARIILCTQTAPARLLSSYRNCTFSPDSFASSLYPPAATFAPAQDSLCPHPQQLLAQAHLAVPSLLSSNRAWPTWSRACA